MLVECMLRAPTVNSFALRQLRGNPQTSQRTEKLRRASNLKIWHRETDSRCLLRHSIVISRQSSDTKSDSKTSCSSQFPPASSVFPTGGLTALAACTRHSLLAVGDGRGFVDALCPSRYSVVMQVQLWCLMQTRTDICFTFKFATALLPVLACFVDRLIPLQCDS